MSAAIHHAHGKSFQKAVRRTLLWFAGMPLEAVNAHRLDVQMRYTAAGLVVAVWYCFMLIVWAKAGAYWLGTPGAVAFMLVPTLILAVDRMILGQTRNPKGELAAYAIPALQPRRWEYGLRIAVAAAFSAASTMAFVVTQAASDIRARQQVDQQKANEPLRRELVAQIQTEFDERMRTIKTRTSELDAQSSMLKEELTVARQTADEAEAQARRARFNVAAEAGGIEGRARGEGQRHAAYAQIARQSQDSAINSRGREGRARDALAKVQVELQQLNVERERATSKRHAALQGVSEDMEADARFVSRKKGVFADSTTLIRLYSDPDLGPGLLLTTLIVSAVLLCCELAPMLGLAFLSSTPVEIERIAANRADAARIVAQHELAMAREASRPQVRVRPSSPHEQRVPQAGDPGR